MHPGQLSPLDQAQAVIAALFDDRVATAVTDPSAPQPPTLEGEGEHLARALPVRKSEFAAGRAAARLAMASLDLPLAAVPAGPDRAPIWPVGVAGSISHTRSLCAAAVTTAPVFLGLDIEVDSSLNQDLLSTICSQSEISEIVGPDQGRLAKLIFSAKEAAFKAQFPVTHEIFGFDHMEIRLNLGAKQFHAAFTKPVSPFAVGDKLHGRFDRVAGHIVTGVTLPRHEIKGA